MRIAVTGGSGLVGRAIVRRLTRHHDVVNIDISDPGSVMGDHDTAGVGLSAPGLTPASCVPAAHVPAGRAPVEHARTEHARTEHARTEYVPADILDLTRLISAVRGAQAVVHAAAIPGPAFGSEDDIQRVNVEGTRNVALAAGRAGVRRIVFISSESVLGFVFSGGAVGPDYLPVDEAHPLAPTDPYGRSKLAAEMLLARYAGDATTVVSLRPPWVWVPEEYEKLRRLTEEPAEWSGGLWAYVHGDDLARAAERAATGEMEPGFHAAYVAAPDNGTVLPSAKLIDEYLPGVPLRGGLAEFGSLISSDRLEQLLGFRPTMSWREFLR